MIFQLYLSLDIYRRLNLARLGFFCRYVRRRGCAEGEGREFLDGNGSEGDVKCGEMWGMFGERGVWVWWDDRLEWRLVDGWRMKMEVLPTGRERGGYL